MRRSLILLSIVCITFMNASVYLNTARIAFFNEQDYKRAKKACLEGIKKGDTHFELYAILSACEISYSNWHAAVKALKGAFSKDSLHTLDWIRKRGGGEKYYHQAFYFSALDYFKKHKYEEALNDIKYTAYFDYCDKNSSILKGAILFKLGRIEEANREYLDILSRDPKNPDINFLIGKSLFEAGAFDSCLKYFINAMKYYRPKYKRTLQVLFQNKIDVDDKLTRKVLRLWFNKQLQELDELFKKELKLTDGLAAHNEVMLGLSRAATDLAHTYYYIGMVYYNLKEDSAALQNLENCLRFKPDDIDALFFASEILIKFKEYQKAREYLEELTKINPDDQDAWFYLAVCYTQLGFYKRAIEIYENRMLPVDPNRVEVLTNLAYLYAQLGNDAKSNEYLQRAKENEGR